MTSTSLRLDRGRPVAPSDGVLSPLGIDDVRIRGGFWADRQALNAQALIEHCEYWVERAGWVANFDAARDGRLPQAHTGREFADSDVYKLLEAMAWEIGRTGDEAMNERFQAIVERIAPVQEADGYLNTFFGRPGQAPRYSDLEWGHELYCYGHLIQAAIARGRTVGADLLVDIARRAADHVCDTFGVGGIERVCGHPEIEVALAEFARYTGDDKYLEQARLFTYQAGAAAGYPEARAALPLQRRTVREVNRIVEDLGRTPAFEAERTSDVDRVLPGLGDVRSRTDFVRFAHELEAVAKAARAELPPAIP